MKSHNTETSMSVLERQRSTVKLHQKQLTQTKHFTNFYQNGHFGNFLSNNHSINDQISFNSETLLNGAMKSEHDVENNTWNDGFGGLLSCTGNEFELHGMTYHHMIPRTDSFKKRKADKSHDLIEATQAVAEEKSQKRKMKGCEEESKITEQDSNSKSTITSADDSSKNSDKSKKRACKNNSKDDSKTDYIHVRARRGQATDSHSLAERVRREKISERMRFLQDLVPGCNKVTGKAGMLDEIINYVQSLQKQVESLSMKLAAVNSTTLDFDVMNGLSKEEVLLNPDQLQFNTLLQELPCFEIISPQDIGCTIGTPVSIQDPFFDSSCFNVCGDAGDVMIQGLEGAQF